QLERLEVNAQAAEGGVLGDVAGERGRSRRQRDGEELRRHEEQGAVEDRPRGCGDEAERQERGGGSSEGVLQVERDGGPEDGVVAGGEGGDAIGPWPSRSVVEPLRGTAEVLGGGGVRGAHRHADGLLLRGLAAAVDGPAVEELAAGARGRRERDADA